jgi:hypothetical protein
VLGCPRITRNFSSEPPFETTGRRLLLQWLGRDYPKYRNLEELKWLVDNQIRSPGSFPSGYCAQ